MDEDTNLKLPIVKPSGFGQRHHQILSLVVGLTICYAYATNLPVAMVAMIDNSSNPNFSTVDWSEKVRGFIFAGSSFGYLISQFFSGNVVQRYGGKRVLFIAVLILSILTTCKPLIIPLGWQYVIAKQILQGITSGFVLPSAVAVQAKWVHPIERPILGPAIPVTMFMGTALMTGISGLIAASVFGWPGIFYIPGICGIIWSFYWLYMGANTPDECRSISKEERIFIESMPDSSKLNRSIPWREILRSRPVWTLAFCQFGEFFCYVLLITCVPTYITGIFHLNLRANAFFSALPHILMLLMTVVFSNISNILLKREVLSLGLSRKIFTTIGMVTPAVLIFCLRYASDSVALALSLITFAIGINASVNAGFMINNLDLSPNFAGSIVSMIGAVSICGGIFSPILVGFVVKDIHDSSLWEIVFTITAVVYLLANILFVLFGDVNVQPWNEPKVHAYQAVPANVIEETKILTSDMTKNKLSKNGSA